MRPGQKVETFPDGCVKIYAAADGRKVGDFKLKLNYEQQSVGVNRYYQAQTSVKSVKVDRLIKVPHTKIVSEMDIAIINSDQYRIARIQQKPERSVDLLELQSVQVLMEVKT